MAIENWEIKPASAQIKKQWDKAINAEPIIMHDEKIRLETKPLDRGNNPRRTHQLKGPLATRKVGGVTYDQWQHEITSTGRIWYCPDKRNRIIWITLISFTHPKESE